MFHHVPSHYTAKRGRSDADFLVVYSFEITRTCVGTTNRQALSLLENNLFIPLKIALKMWIMREMITAIAIQKKDRTH